MRLLKIKDRSLDEILQEGILLLEKKVLTGINFEQETPLSSLSLFVQYVHNVESHLSSLILKVQQDYRNRFGNEIVYTLSKKWGLFRWQSKFIPEPGYQYFAVIPEQSKFLLAKIIPDEIPKVPYTVVAKDKGYLLTFDVENSESARFLIDTIRTIGPYFLANGQINPERVDDHSYEKPLFILNDQKNQVLDKSDLELVYLLKLSNGNRSISSLIRANLIGEFLSRLVTLSCRLDLRVEERYLGKEFFSDY